MKHRPSMVSPVVLVSLLLALPACEITSDGVQQQPVALVDIFPPSKSVASYRQVAPPKRIMQDDLITQLGGKERLAQMRKWSSFSTEMCEYGLPNKPPKVRVTISEMTSRIDAYGAYTNIRPPMLPETQYVKIGIHATLEGDRLLLVHDKYLITVRDLEQTPEEQRRAMLVNFGRSISNRIPFPITDVEPASFLPFQNRVPASDRLDKEDPLGLSILQGGAVSALYRIEKRECRVFLARAGEGWSKLAHLNRIKKVMEGTALMTELHIGDAGWAGQWKGNAVMIAQREDIVFGVLGNFSADEMRELMAAMDRRIRPYVPVHYSDIQKAEEKKAENKGGGYQWTP
jgi:hypothetical protein